MGKRNFSLEVVDSSDLTDTDWAEINRLKLAYENGGQEALSKAMDALAEDPVRSIRVIGAFFPDLVREAIRDGLAERGVTEEDIRDLLRRVESSSRKTH
jgi:hypothetical protein